MTALISEPSGSHEAGLVRTPKGEGLHLPDCPHVLGSDVHVATAEERESVRICEWSQAELAGVGRRRFDALDDAMRYFGMHVGTESLVRELVRDLLVDLVWVPNSGSYIALAVDGRVAAWVHKGHVQFADGRLEKLPGYAPGGGGSARADEQLGEICTTHFVVRGLNGSCEMCE